MDQRILSQALGFISDELANIHMNLLSRHPLTRAERIKDRAGHIAARMVPRDWDDIKQLCKEPEYADSIRDASLPLATMIEDADISEKGEGKP